MWKVLVSWRQPWILGKCSQLALPPPPPPVVGYMELFGQYDMAAVSSDDPIFLYILP